MNHFSRRTISLLGSLPGLLFGLAAFVVVPSGVCFAHPGHPHFPGVAAHLPYESADSAGLALTIALFGLCLGASFIELAIVLFRLGAAGRAAFRSRRIQLTGRLRTLITTLFSFLLVSSFFFAGCSSGGGGDGGGAPGSRPGSPAVRILHGSIDLEPVHLNAPDLSSTTSRFADSTASYLSFPEGPQTLLLERNNAPGTVIGTVSGQIQSDTFYSVLLTGEVNEGTYRASLIAEPDVRAEKGRARVQVIHSLLGAAPIVVTGTGFTLGPVNFTGSSGFVDVAMGPQTLSLSTTDGRSLGTVSLTLADRGEATVLVTGSTQDGVIVKRVYDDIG